MLRPFPDVSPHPADWRRLCLSFPRPHCLCPLTPCQRVLLLSPAVLPAHVVCSGKRASQLLLQPCVLCPAPGFAHTVVLIVVVIVVMFNNAYASSVARLATARPRPSTSPSASALGLLPTPMPCLSSSVTAVPCNHVISCVRDALARHLLVTGRH